MEYKTEYFDAVMGWCYCRVLNEYHWRIKYWPARRTVTIICSKGHLIRRFNRKVTKRGRHYDRPLRTGRWY